MLDLPSIEYLFSNNPRVPTINAILVVSINCEYKQRRDIQDKASKDS